ncbi:MAG: aminopeptidase P family protein [Candidatus Latescibacteria bacterium]|nr:aminopeptidase P family protein [Candidatus Latescibacterota bacterium]
MLAASEGDANMYYATGLFVPDPFTYIEQNGTTVLIMSDLEIDRAKAHSKANTVLSLTAYQNRLKERGLKSPKLTDVVAEVLKERGIRSVLVPATFPVGYADQLRGKGFSVRSKADPFFEERTVKSAQEIAHISDVSRHTESAMRAAIAAISQATVRDGLLYGPDGVLTAEAIKRLISVHLLERDYIAQHTIIACGVQGCDPHNQGSGPLRAGQPIILDVFPKSAHTGYYADITRTVVKGRASDALKRVYDTLLATQELVFGRVKDGVEGQDVHREVEEFFKQSGYETGEINGRMQGFFHGTGHGIG